MIMIIIIIIILLIMMIIIIVVVIIVTRRPFLSRGADTDPRGVRAPRRPRSRAADTAGGLVVGTWDLRRGGSSKGGFEN